VLEDGRKIDRQKNIQKDRKKLTWNELKQREYFKNKYITTVEKLPNEWDDLCWFPQPDIPRPAKEVCLVIDTPS
jgi:hypothetical protein